MITHTLNLELAKKIDSIGVPIVVRTMDNETQVISANLFMRGQDYAPTCESARLDIMHEDGSWARIDATTSGHTASATLPSKALTNGVSMAYFAFVKGPQIETTESFVLRVVASAQETPESDRYFDASINRLYEKWKNFEAGAEHAEDLRKAAETKRESDFNEAQNRHETAYTEAEQKRTSAFNQAEEERTHAENDRASAEQGRTDAESKRVSAEQARVAEETSRTEAEQKREAAETTRADAESTRASQEQARTNAEQTRVSQENARVAAEEARAHAETARTHAEDTRTSAEDTRKSEEQKREDAESARVSAESARADAEGKRATAEQARVNEEQTRASQERTRQTQEQQRVLNEDTRTQAAQAQADAESKRDLAEAARAQAEALRVAEESKRATAESGRATEEESRKTRFAQMMDAAQNVKFKIVQADDNGTPLGEGVAGIIYLVRGKTDSTTNEYTEWIWYEGRWELFGTSGATVEPITPQDIDTVAQDGTISGTRVLSATALNYLWTKLEAKYQTQAQVAAAVSASTEPLAAKVQTLDTTKADKQALEDLKASVNTDVKQQLNAINETLATKASADSVNTLEQKAATKDALAQLDANKADKSALETLKQDVGDGVKKKLEDVNATLATKADKETTQAALATKADASALNSAKSDLIARIDLKADRQATQTALATKADKQTTDTFADQATKQLKALREWAESTLQSKMQEKYNEGFSKGKQEGGDISETIGLAQPFFEFNVPRDNYTWVNYNSSDAINRIDPTIMLAYPPRINYQLLHLLLKDKADTEQGKYLIQMFFDAATRGVYRTDPSKDTSFKGRGEWAKNALANTTRVFEMLTAEDARRLLEPKIKTDRADTLVMIMWQTLPTSTALICSLIEKADVFRGLLSWDTNDSYDNLFGKLPAIKEIDIRGSYPTAGNIRQLSRHVFAMWIKPASGITIPEGFRPQTELRFKHERNFYSSVEYDVRVLPSGKIDYSGFAPNPIYALYFA